MLGSFTAAAQEMIEKQLKARGIHDRRVLAAMQRVPREAFVTPSDVALAYADQALPIACEQTISQPYIVALMTQSLEVSGGEHILEIGTGSGYQAAVLAEMGAEVFTIERHPALAQEAAQRLQRLGYDYVHVRLGDGLSGWPGEAPFDRMIITAGGADVPDALWEQLNETGILVAPLGPSAEQTLLALHKIGGRRVTQSLVGCRFVPLLPGIAGEPLTN